MSQDSMFILSIMPRILKLNDVNFVILGINGESAKKDFVKLKQIIEASGGHCEESPRPWGRCPWNKLDNIFFSMDGCMADLIEYILISKKDSA